MQRCVAPAVNELTHPVPACAYCGVAIAQAPEAPAERRQTTIVFSDLSGYTALNERIDPEEVETLVGSLRAIASNIATQHGGTLNQYVGDEVVMLFGVPVARHDDPVRAVRAARALHEAVRRWAAEAAPDWTAGRLTMHSGVNTGLIVTRRSNADSMHAGRYAITGDTVNTGARLLGLAGEDDVVVGMATWHEVEPFFEGEPRVPVSVRGKAHPLAHVRILAEGQCPCARRKRWSGVRESCDPSSRDLADAQTKGWGARSRSSASQASARRASPRWRRASRCSARTPAIWPWCSTAGSSEVATRSEVSRAGCWVCPRMPCSRNGNPR